MKYTINDLKKNKPEFIQWAKNMAADLQLRQEDANIRDVFPNSDTGDIATAKDLVGNLLVALIEEDVEIN